MDETREHRSDEETPAQTATRERAEATEGHVQGVEQAADKGLLSRKQAERVSEAGRKGIRSHDMARGVRSLDDA